jgi:hypothetical protein
MTRAMMVRKVVVYSAAQGLNESLESVDFCFQLLTVASPKSGLALLLVLANTAIASTPTTCRLDLIFDVLGRIGEEVELVTYHI